jgi:hypothetical protein
VPELGTSQVRWAGWRSEAPDRDERPLQGARRGKPQARRRGSCQSKEEKANWGRVQPREAELTALDDSAGSREGLDRGSGKAGRVRP